MDDKELIISLSKEFVKHTNLIEKLKKENLEFYELIQDLKGQLAKAEQNIAKLEKDNSGDWIVK